MSNYDSKRRKFIGRRHGWIISSDLVAMYYLSIFVL
jgi:hypothetical protein